MPLISSDFLISNPKYVQSVFVIAGTNYAHQNIVRPEGILSNSFEITGKWVLGWERLDGLWVGGSRKGET